LSPANNIVRRSSTSYEARYGDQKSSPAAHDLRQSFFRERQFEEVPGLQGVACTRNMRRMAADLRPTGRRQDQDRQPPPFRILLVAEILVRCNQYIETRLRSFQQGPVIELGPPQLKGGRYSVGWQCLPERRRCSMIAKRTRMARPPAILALSDGQTTLRVMQHGLDLLARHAREPVQEIVHPGTVFEILEQRPHRHTRAPDQPLAADPSGSALNGRAFAPIKHGLA